MNECRCPVCVPVGKAGHIAGLMMNAPLPRLRERADKFGIRHTGSKHELVARLVAHILQ